MTNEFTFEQFHQSGERFTPYISINQTGVIGISSGFTKKYEIGEKNAPAATLYFDKTRFLVGIKFSPKKEEGMVNVKYIAGGGAQINGNAFWTKFDVEFKNYVNKYSPKVEPSLGDGFFIIELLNPVNKNS